MKSKVKPSILLNWYDQNARTMPWRIGPMDRMAGILPNPYHVWLSEIMLQQTTVATVKSYFIKFVKKWPTIEKLAQADENEITGAWAGLGYYARARNLLRCAKIVKSEYDGKFPTDYNTLITLPGVGPYTAGAIAAIAYDKNEVVVDGNVERVVSRLFNIQTPLPNSKGEITEIARSLTPKVRPGDYAQAVMDLGATVCTPVAPKCLVCPLEQQCLANKNGSANLVPFKRKKMKKPTRNCFVYIVKRVDRAYLLERRPSKGLLGGMLGWPTSEWCKNPNDIPPVDANWETTEGRMRHTFTHFHLDIIVKFANVPINCKTKQGFFLPENDFDLTSLPTLFQKAYKLENLVK
jgi:A/G-specific adenine glycosylase